MQSGLCLLHSEHEWPSTVANIIGCAVHSRSVPQALSNADFLMLIPRALAQGTVGVDQGTVRFKGPFSHSGNGNVVSMGSGGQINFDNGACPGVPSCVVCRRTVQSSEAVSKTGRLDLRIPRPFVHTTCFAFNTARSWICLPDWAQDYKRWWGLQNFSCFTTLNDG